MATRHDVGFVSRASIPDDQRLFVIRRDFSGGVNNRLHSSRIGENQAEVLDNWDIGIPGEIHKRPGYSAIANDVGADSPVILHNYEIQGTAAQFLMYEDTHLHKWTGTGNWASLKANFTASTDVGIITCKMSGITPDDIVIVQNGTEAFAFKSDGTPLDLIDEKTHKPTLTTVMAWYGNRVWLLKNDLLYFSDAYPADYGEAFNTTPFRLPVGEERALLATRDFGIIVCGKNAIWAINPSPSPVATDQIEPLLTNIGVVSKKGAIIGGDDIYFFSQDGFRALKRTGLDKLQMGADYPISYKLKTEFERISWANISKLSMEYFDNKIFISVPTGAATFDLWVYYPVNDSFAIVRDADVSCWGKFKVSGEERLYAGEVGDGVVNHFWTGLNDSGTAIEADFVGREEDFQQPLIKKVGGEVEIEASSAGGEFALSVYAAFDGKSFEQLGTLALDEGDAPTLPIDLPFDLADRYVVRKKFPIDKYGAFRTIQIKVVNEELNTDPVILYAYQVVTFPEEYQEKET